ncbi:SDR family NAD(P)-dependent oxidoreductase [Cryobacterium tepidiphilum]|uniref:SDR family NAD(P)-dependent oxidoreductase n=1 Tax=Cryobacterium tepidiphilum TaxID=2486026 RepID=UPI00131440E0|nr:SDR family NAD(P)-dependent oxidoreductase [Cryobacterium tepidiphilum]
MITGAGSGIGRELAVEFGRRGGDLLLVGRRQETLDETAELVRSAGGAASILELDVTAPGAAERIQAAAASPDLLVNNAGNVRAGRLDELPESDIHAMIDLNLTAPILLTRSLLGPLRAAGSDRGSIILNISSGIALVGMPFYTVYAATKSGIAHFGEALRRELHGTGVHVATAYPGATATPMMDSSTAGEDLGFGRRPVEDVVADVLAALESGAHEINTALPTRRKMQDLNVTDPLAVDAALAPRLGALEEATREHRSM